MSRGVRVHSCSASDSRLTRICSEEARQVEYVIATAVRVLVPLLMFRWPLAGVLLSMLTDVSDFAFLNTQTPEAYAFYQSWDRALDLYFYLVSIPMVMKWKDASSRSIAFAFLGYRMIGQVLFFLAQSRRFLFFFPNFYDNFLVIYLGYVLIFKRSRLIDSPVDVLVIGPLLLIPKIVHEYFLHFLELQPWERYDVGSFLGLAGMASYVVNISVWSTLFYVLPFLGVFLYFRWKFRNTARGEMPSDRPALGQTS